MSLFVCPPRTETKVMLWWDSLYLQWLSPLQTSHLSQFQMRTSLDAFPGEVVIRLVALPLLLHLRRESFVSRHEPHDGQFQQWKKYKQHATKRQLYKSVSRKDKSCSRLLVGGVSHTFFGQGVAKAVWIRTILTFCLFDRDHLFEWLHASVYSIAQKMSHLIIRRKNNFHRIALRTRSHFSPRQCKSHFFENRPLLFLTFV